MSTTTITIDHVEPVMDSSSASPDTSSTHQPTTRVHRAVSAHCSELRERHPILRHANALGSGILVLTLIGMVGSALLYLEGILPWWACLLLNAFFASIAHELEHDLIHDLYWRKAPFRQNLMFVLTWLCRPTAINPWVRRRWHITHHKCSGTEGDVEERVLSNGVRWGLVRLLITGDLMLSASLMTLQAKTWAERRTLLWLGVTAFTPVTVLSWATWYAFLGFHASNGLSSLLGEPIVWSSGTLSAMHAVDIATVVLIGPNILRTFCLNFVTSNLHYYGDIEPENIIQQTQVLNPWWLWPFQAFCFNFGSTHAIHHFVVKETFYVRQLSAPMAHGVMRQMGVRFNDLGSFRRANRWRTVSAN